MHQVPGELILSNLYPRLDIFSRIALSRVSKRYARLNRTYLAREKEKWVHKDTGLVFDGRRWGPRIDPHQWRDVVDYPTAPVKTVKGHDSAITGLTVLADGRVASGCRDGSIMVWDIDAGVCELTLDEHSNGIGALMALPENRLVSGSWDGTIRHWDVCTGKCLSELTVEFYVNALAVLPDGSVLAGLEDGTIQRWDIKAQRCMATLEGHKAEGEECAVTAFAVLGNGDFISACEGGKIKHWEMASGKCLNTLEGHSSVIAALTVLLDGTLISVSNDRCIKQWDIKTGRCLTSIEGHAHYIRDVGVLPSGTVITASCDNTIKCWDIRTGRCLNCIEEKEATQRTTKVVVLTDGSLVCGVFDGSLTQWCLVEKQRALKAESTGESKEEDEVGGEDARDLAASRYSDIYQRRKEQKHTIKRGQKRGNHPDPSSQGSDQSDEHSDGEDVGVAIKS